jgi:hypothetical protein
MAGLAGDASDLLFSWAKGVPQCAQRKPPTRERLLVRLSWPGETALFFQRQSTYAVSRADTIRLLERTEGWIAGLQLAVLVLNTQGTEETMSSALQGNHRYVADYLVQEVLKHLPENVQLFLQQTSLPKLRRQESWFAALLQGDVQGAITVSISNESDQLLTRVVNSALWTGL